MKIVIVGAGNQGSIVADALAAAHESGASARAIGFVDEQREGSFAALPILGKTSALETIEHDAVIVAIGDNAVRRRVIDELLARGETLAIARHPFSSIAPTAIIEPGVMISAGVIVAPNARIGLGALLNTKASIDHDTNIGRCAHISCGATVAGRIDIGDEVLIGAGATVLSGCSVGARSIVGAGAVVVRDVPADVVAFGNPARVRRSR